MGAGCGVVRWALHYSQVRALCACTAPNPKPGLPLVGCRWAATFSISPRMSTISWCCTYFVLFEHYEHSRSHFALESAASLCCAHHLTFNRSRKAVFVVLVQQVFVVVSCELYVPCVCHAMPHDSQLKQSSEECTGWFGMRAASAMILTTDAPLPSSSQIEKSATAVLSQNGVVIEAIRFRNQQQQAVRRVQSALCCAFAHFFSR